MYRYCCHRVVWNYILMRESLCAGLNELDDGQDRGLALTANQRALLMQRLSRGEQIGANMPQPTAVEQPQAAGAVPTLPGYNPPLAPSRVPSRCLMLRNLFDPAEETEPDFQLQVRSV